MIFRDRALVDFGEGPSLHWQPVDDVVMGGRSDSSLRPTGEGTGLFAGRVSFENDGGFASVRAAAGPLDLTSFDGLAANLLGDGREYRLRVRTGGQADGIAWQAPLPTSGGWEVVAVPFDRFTPTLRGKPPPGSPSLDTSNVGQIGLMIADRQEGRFRLELRWIKAYRLER